MLKSCSYLKEFHIKNCALDTVNGTSEKEYQILLEYCKGLIESNSGTITTLKINEDRKFCGIFLYLEASADRFMYRPSIFGLNKTHLKQKYQSILLTATTVHTQGSLFPLAFTIVDAENDENWF